MKQSKGQTPVASRMVTRVSLKHKRVPLWVLGLLAAFVTTLLTVPAQAQIGAGASTIAATLGPVAPTFTDDVYAVVTVTAAAAPVPTGSITWDTDSGGQLTAPLVNGVARIELKFFAPGAHTFAYSYSGDPTYAAVASQSAPFTVVDRAFTMYGSDHPLRITGPSQIDNLALDSKDALIIPDHFQNKLFKVDPKGIVSTIPTTGLNDPIGVVVDKQDDIFLADNGNSRVLEITAAGAQSVLPITGLTSAVSLSFDPAYQNLYVVDLNAGTIVIFNLASQTQTSFSPGIPDLTSVAVDPTGIIYYAQGENTVDTGHLYRRDTAGNVTEIFTGLTNIAGLFLDAKGNLYLASGNGTFVVDPLGHLTELTAITYYASPSTPAVDSHGRIYIANAGVSVFTPGNSGDTGFNYDANYGVAHDPSFPVVGGPPGDATLDYQAPYQQSFTSVSSQNAGVLGLTNGSQTGYAGTGSSSGVAFLLQAYLFPAPVAPGQWSTTIAITTTDGTTHTNIAYGIGVAGEFAVTPGTITPGSPGVSSIGGVATDGNGNAYVSDPGANQVLQVSSSASTVLPFTGLNTPTQVAVDVLGSVFVLDSGSSRILRLDALAHQTVAFDLSAQSALTSLGTFTLDAGDNLYIAGQSAGGQVAIYLLDTQGNQRLIAQNVALPAALALDGFADLYAVETAGGNLRRYDQAGNPTLVATGLTQPASLAVDPGGTAFVSGPAGSGITVVHPDGTTNPYPSTALANASALANDFLGNLVIGDNTGKQIVGITRVPTHEFIYDFGNVPLGTTETYTGQLNNAGNAITSDWAFTESHDETALTSDPNECIGATPTPNTPLPAGGYCNMNITFTPTYLGPMNDNTGTGNTYYVVQPSTFGVYLSLDLTGNGTTPVGVPTLSPNPLNFGNITVNTTSGLQQISVVNNNISALSISSVAIGGANAAEFSETTTCPASLPSNTSCAILVSFTPNAVGAATATVTLTDNAATSTSTVAIEGTGVAPAGQPSIHLSPPAVTFPTTVFGSSSAAQTLVVSNSGSAAATISSVTLAGADVTSFALTNGCGATLGVNASCNLTVVFTPTSAGQTFNATVSIVSNDQYSPATAALTGSSTAAPVAAATLSPSTLAFPSETISTASPSQPVTLSNTGTTVLGIASIAVGGVNAASFTQTNSCGATLAAGANCSIQVVFDPADLGSLTGSVTVQFSAPVSDVKTLRAHVIAIPAPLTTSLTGVGVAVVTSAPIAALTPATITYTATTGSTTAAQTATLTNSGTATLNISGITLAGANTADFAISANTCGATLAAGANCVLSVTFTPSAAGSFTASLSVADDAAGSPQTSTLAGTGTAAAAVADFTIAATPSTQSVAAGSAATYGIPVTSSGGSFMDVVTLTATGLPPGATVSFTPASVTPGAAGAQSTMSVQTAVQVAANVHESSRWPFGAPAFAAVLLLIPGWRTRRRLLAKLNRGAITTLGCLLVLLSMMATITGCGAGFNGPAPTAPAGATYTITVTGTSGATTHNTTVQITVR